MKALVQHYGLPPFGLFEQQTSCFLGGPLQGSPIKAELGIIAYGTAAHLQETSNHDR